VAKTGAPYSVYVSMRSSMQTFNGDFAYHEGALFPDWQLGRLIDEDILESLLGETSGRPFDALSAAVPSDHPFWDCLELRPRALRGLVMVNLQRCVSKACW
jgi:hypothetical protein